MTRGGSPWGPLTPAERRRSLAFWGLQAVLVLLDVAGAVHWPWWVVWSPLLLVLVALALFVGGSVALAVVAVMRRAVEWVEDRLQFRWPGGV